MSLDVTIYEPPKPVDLDPDMDAKIDQVLSSAGLVSDNDEFYHEQRGEYYSANITHNLGQMAKEAGIYHHLWRPDEIEITTARELIQPLSKGLKKLKLRPRHYQKFDSPNGWGTYENFVPFVEKYLEACKKHPDGIIHACR